MSILPPDPDGKTGRRETTVDQLTSADFGMWVHVPTADIPGRCSGYLYAIHDDYNDGYPSRTLILVHEDGGDDSLRFTDSDPAGYPKTMRLPCIVALNPMVGR